MFKTDKRRFNRPPKEFWWKKGVSANPKGRPKGKSMKEFTREYLSKLPEEERLKFLESLPNELAWRMAEGNPEIVARVDTEINLKISKLDDIRKSTKEILEN